jgi:hypothetical protein
MNYYMIFYIINKSFKMSQAGIDNENIFNKDSISLIEVNILGHKMFKCPTCRKIFKTKGNLKTHTIIHVSIYIYIFFYS